ncbi:MAG: hypothetical protein HQL57_09855 [Magnetococcales bacterium]|nr:hypothetical protein [Magnetococcales bacterium]
MIYCFDIDGTLCTNTEGAYEEAEPFAEVVAEVNRLYDQGETIILLTARGSTTGIDWREVTERQLRQWGVPYHALHLGKPSAHVYVDDKAVNAVHWRAGGCRQSLEEAQRPSPPPLATRPAESSHSRNNAEGPRVTPGGSNIGRNPPAAPHLGEATGRTRIDLPSPLPPRRDKAELHEVVARHALGQLAAWDPRQPEYGPNDSVDPSHTEPYAPDWADLVRLHDLILQRRVTTILEFGCGHSTAIMAHALEENRRRHGAFVEANLRRNNPFELHTIDDMPAYLEATAARLPPPLAARVHFHHSPVAMTRFNGRIATEYQRLPNICPDFIYLDGPSQHSVLGEVNGISTRHPDRLPMAADILALEHFLLPGTLILVDGRTANARFLATNLQRTWTSGHDPEADVHWFELRESPLGRLNAVQLRFSLGEEWLAAVSAP